jgi:hypothetical protein
MQMSMAMMKMITELCGGCPKWTEVKEISVILWIEELVWDAIEETIAMKVEMV